MRIFCVIPDLGPGGAQRVMSLLAEDLAQRHDVAIMTWERESEKSFYPLPPNARVIKADSLGHGLSRLWRIASRPGRLRREARAFGADVVLSFTDTMNVTAILACLGLGVPVVVSERNDPHHRRIGRAKSLARRAVYPFAARVVVQTERIARYFPRGLAPKIRVIANPAPRDPQQARPGLAGAEGRKRLIAAGRLEDQKGFDRLLRSFALVRSDFPDWDLVIFGEGSRREALEALARKLGLGDRVRMPGVTREIGAELAASHLMVFPSLYEGFPNALAEALSAGLPAIGHCGVSGVEDMIIPGETGDLVNPCDGREALAAAMSRLMADDSLRARMGAAARLHMARWSPKQVLGAWEAILREAAAR